MKRPGQFPAALILTVATLQSPLQSQAVPFLTIPLSPSGNALGGSSTTAGADDPFTLLTNPAYLGIHTLTRSAYGGTFIPSTSWLKVFNPDIRLRADVLELGFRLDPLLSLPFGASVGFGYIHSRLDLGTFVYTGNSPTDILATYDGVETMEGVSVAIGLETFVRLGAGLTFKSVVSNLAPFRVTFTSPPLRGARASMADVGVVLTLPVSEWFYEGTPSEGLIRPVAELTLVQAVSNLGGSITYADQEQNDPLPRTATMGQVVKLGVATYRNGAWWELISLGRVSQAEQLMLSYQSEGAWRYRSWPGDIGFLKNVAGETGADRIMIRVGTEIRLMEMITYRSGAFSGPGFPRIKTLGGGVNTRGLVRMLELLDLAPGRESAFGRILSRVSVTFDVSEYSIPGHPLDGTNFSGLTVEVRRLD